MSLHRSTVVAVCTTVLVIASLSVPSSAAPRETPERPSRALQRWTSGAADPAVVLAAIRRHPDKTPVEFDERLKWADSNGSLQVMVSLVRRDDKVESFVAAHTDDVSWYGDDPRFLARVTPNQLVTLLGAPVVLFVEPDYPITSFMSDSAADVRARTPDADGVYTFDPDTGPMGRILSNVEGLTADQVTGSGVRVAITDSGIDKTHRDFGGWECEAGPYRPCDSRIVETVTVEHLVPGFEPSDALPTTEAASGHGSHVAGTIAGNGYYSRDFGADAPRYGGDGYVIGVAPTADIVSVKNGDSQSAAFSTAALQWQLDHAEELGIRVSSNSWGCLGGCSFNPNSATSQVVRDLYLAGVVVAFAAGNDGGGDNGAAFSGFAQSPYVLGVAAYDDATDRLASFSSRGSSDAPLYDPTTWTPESEPVNGTRRPDVAAPGVSIWSAATLTGGTSAGLPRVSIGDVDAGRGPTVEYRLMSGTSMATPHVAGTATLLSGACPDATPLDVMRAIMVGANETKVLKTAGSDRAQPFEVGHGGLDVRAGLDWLLSLPVCGGEGDPEPTPTPTPTPSPTGTPEPPPPPELPSDEDAAVVDPFGDANYVNDQGADAGIGDQVTPTDAASVADLGKIWFTNTADSISVHVQTEAKGPATAGLFYRVQVDPGTGTRCLWLQGATAGAGNLTGNEATLRDTCPSAVPTSSGSISFFDGPNGTGIMSLTFPFSAHPAFGPGKILRSPAAHSRHFAGVVTAPQIDNTIAGRDYEIAADPGPDPTPSPTETESPSPTPSPTADPGGRGSYPTDPDDPFFANQWGMVNIQAPEAWQETRATGHGIKIAIVDSGVDLGHPDLSCPGKLLVLPGAKIESEGPPQDEDGHGTHVAGIAGACTNNGVGVVGVAPDATIMPVNVFEAESSILPGGFDHAMAEGIRFATQNGAHVINLSIGPLPGESYLTEVHPETEAALEEAYEAGVVIAAASGNFSMPLCEYPSLSRFVICVSAVDRDDQKAWYSDLPNNIDRGADQPGLEPSVVAPGGQGTFCQEGIVSSYLTGEGGNCGYPDGYQDLDGTSMASPHVAGVAALLYDRAGGQRSGEAGRQIIDAILASADDLGAPGYDPIYGYGRVNALKAAQAIELDPESETQDAQLSFTEDSATSGQYTDQASLAAVLTDSEGDPIEGAELVFELTGAESSRTFDATTDEDGIASVAPTLSEKPGVFQLIVRYAGDDDFEGSADTTAFVVDREDTDLNLRVEGKGKERTVSARLSDGDASSDGIEGRTVHFYADGEPIGSAPTDANGVATVSPPRRYRGGKHTFEASFEGDDFYVGSGDQ